jgi:hypothetical protein
MSDKKCPSCGENPAGETEIVSFEFQGIKVEFRKFGSQCVECAQKDFEKKFSQYAPGAISISNGQIDVSWEAVLSLKKKSSKREAILFLLIDLGVLSHSSLGNWEVVACNININPLGGGELFFTRREDAESFAKSDLGAALYPWEIRHIDQVIKSFEESPSE